MNKRLPEGFSGNLAGSYSSAPAFFDDFGYHDEEITKGPPKIQDGSVVHTCSYCGKRYRGLDCPYCGGAE